MVIKGKTKKKGFAKSKSFWAFLLALGSLSGLMTLPHTIFEMRRDMPAIQYEYTGGGDFSSETDPSVIEKNFNGKLKNLSHSPNSITSISLVVFNADRNGYLRDGFTAEKIFEFSGPGEGHEIALPIQLAPKETRMLNIISFISLSGTDKELFDSSYTKMTDHGFESAKYQFELLFQDVNGNHFDVNGNLINQELMDLKWIYQDEKWYSFRPFYEKTKSRIGFFTKRWMSFLGMNGE